MNTSGNVAVERKRSSSWWRDYETTADLTTATSTKRVRTVANNGVYGRRTLTGLREGHSSEAAADTAAGFEQSSRCLQSERGCDETAEGHDDARTT